MASGDETNLVESQGLRNQYRVFADRQQAGLTLATMLREYAGPDTLVLGIPAGGVTVAVEIARELNAQFDVAVVNKVTPPWNSEWGFGAVAFDGSVVMDEDIVATLGMTPSDVESCVEKARAKVRRRVSLLRGDRPLPALADRRVIVADDGLATGVTMRGAVEALTTAGAERIIVAVPTAHEESANRLLSEGKVDILYCPNICSGYEFAVAQAYRYWHDMSDEEIVAAMDEFSKWRQAG